MRKLILGATLLGLSFGPVFAQATTPSAPGVETKPTGTELSGADCQRNFRIADANGDGMLSMEEQEAAKEVIPTALALSGPISRTEFMTLCTQNIPKGG